MLVITRYMFIYMWGTWTKQRGGSRGEKEEGEEEEHRSSRRRRRYRTRRKTERHEVEAHNGAFLNIFL